MKISCVSERITVIELSAQEVTKYAITFKESDYSDAKSRSALWQVISEAERLSGKKLKIGEGLEIDFMPDVKGGCLLIISENEIGMRSAVSQNTVLQSKDINNVLDFSLAVCKNAQGYASSLYFDGESYRILIEKIDEKLLLTALEFDFEVCSISSFYESTREVCACLIDKNALEILSGTFTKT